MFRLLQSTRLANQEIYDGLVSVPWRRVVAHAHHRLIAKNMWLICNK